MVRLMICAVLLLPAFSAIAVAQPADPDLEQAAAMYRAAEQAMTEGRYDDAARDYGAAYEIAKDAVLFFKIGSALDKAGKCPVAVTYYRRYLREGKPAADFRRLTTERIAGCEAGGGDATAPPASVTTDEPPAPPPPDRSPEPDAPDAPASALDAEPAPEGPRDATDAATTPGEGADDADRFPPPSPRRTAAWIAVGSGLAFATVGAVFALSVESTEDDLADLYLVRPGGSPAAFEGSTRKRYQDLVDRGDRYQALSWVSFGLAGAAAAAATYFFVTSSPEHGGGKPLALHPTLSPHGAGVDARWTW